MDTFSDSLLRLARDYLGGAIEQYSVFQEQIRPGPTRVDHRSGRVWIGEREFAGSGEIGTYAEDLTFMWAWAKPTLEGLPGVAASTRVRELGLRHGIPEFAEGVVDLSGFTDPMLAADNLSIIALGALGARGMTKFNHGGRAYAYLIVDDEQVPSATPDPGRVAELVGAAARMLPGTGARAVVAGYAHRHRLPVRDTADGVEVQLPDGPRLIARIGDGDRLLGAEDLGASASAPAGASATSRLSGKKGGIRSGRGPAPAGALALAPRTSAPRSRSPSPIRAISRGPSGSCTSTPSAVSRTGRRWRWA